MKKIGIILVVMILAFAKSSYAGITVTPGRHEVELAPGRSMTVKFQIYNSGPDDLDMTTDPKEWVRLKENKDKRYKNYGKFIFNWLSRTEKNAAGVLQPQQPRIIREY